MHYSPDRGRTWETLSPDLTTNDPAKLEQATSGGLTIDATQAENHCTILCIAPSQERPNELWVGTDDGRLQHSTDRGVTWTDHANQLKGLPEGSWIPFIHVSPHSPDEIYVVANNYRRNDGSRTSTARRTGGNLGSDWSTAKMCLPTPSVCFKTPRPRICSSSGPRKACISAWTAAQLASLDPRRAHRSRARHGHPGA